MSETNNNSSGVGLFGIVFVVFLILKLAEIGPVAAWSWWWVTAPLWGGAAQVTVSFATTDFETVSAARAKEVADVISRQVDGLDAGVDEGFIQLVSATVGAASSINILATTSPDLLTILGLTLGTTLGTDGDIEVLIP